MQSRVGTGQLCQRQCQYPGAHGGGKPVGGELANDFHGMLQVAKRLDTGFGDVGAGHDELLSSGEVELIIEPDRISI
ncbi:hypothetical protein D3C87_1489360 [compost metagenome]